MNPSGGYRSNDIADSLMIPLVTDTVLLPYVLPRAELLEMQGAYRHSMARANATRVSNLTAGRKARVKRSTGLKFANMDIYSELDVFESEKVKPNQRRYTPEESARRRAAATAQRDFRSRRAKIAARYSSIKSATRAVGWGYLALTAAEMGAGIFAPTPGVNTLALENDAAAMGYNNRFQDSSQAYTQRQRALMAIHDSQLGIRNVIGAEAPHLHR